MGKRQPSHLRPQASLPSILECMATAVAISIPHQPCHRDEEPEQVAASPHRTEGKANFDDLYNNPDPTPYMNGRGQFNYEIGQYTAGINRLAIQKFGVANSVVCEVCCGYGLSMASMRTTHTAAEIHAHYFSPERQPGSADQLRLDAEFHQSAMDPTMAGMRTIGVDVAHHALEYGQLVGLFDHTVARNLETCALLPAEAELIGSATLVVATGAFSYITPRTIEKISQCFGKRKPWFLLYPLVATSMDQFVRFFEQLGMHVYYEPAKHWLPQREFKDEQEQQALEATMLSFFDGQIPQPYGFKPGYCHAVPLVACQTEVELAQLVSCIRERTEPPRRK